VPQEDQRSLGITAPTAVQEQVGEGEVRQESPDADEVLEVRYLSLVEVRMRTGQVGQRRHVPTPLSAASAQPKPTGLSDPAAPMST
jgi:hypothetical protein